MAQLSPLEIKYKALPRSVNFENDVLPTLEKHGISRATFFRDVKAKAETIPTLRLNVYSQLFDCSIDELMQGYTKVKIKPIIKRPSIAKQIGLKS